MRARSAGLGEGAGLLDCYLAGCRSRDQNAQMNYGAGFGTIYDIYRRGHENDPRSPCHGRYIWVGFDKRFRGRKAPAKQKVS